jgi:hypothetical protein
MPEIFRINGFVFYFYANEGTEPMHVHVRRGGGFAKFWMEPISLDYSQGLSPRELNQAEVAIDQNQHKIK